MPDLAGAVVLQVLPALRSGGVEQGTVDMVAAIAQAGGQPLVASAGGAMVEAVLRAGGRHVVLPLATKNPLAVWRNAARLERLVLAANVSLVHARSRAPAWSALLAAQRTRRHFLTTYHAPYDEGLPGKRAYNAVMASGERVIAISRFLADLIVERHRVSANRLRVIPRGVDPSVFDPDRVEPERVEHLRRAWRLDAAGPVVMLPARLSRWKGHDVLINAMRWSRTTGLIAVMVGPVEARDRYAAELTRRAEAAGVAGRVHFVGHCSDIPAALLLADVVVSPSTQPEGFGRTVIEAQAMRRPVIAADHGGAVETIEHGSTGWRVPPGDPVALAAAIDRTLAMRAAERDAVGRQARQAVLARYTVQAMQNATLDVYRELLR